MAFDWNSTVLTQYANSPSLMQWLENIAGYFSPDELNDAFYDQVWNIDTAQGWGLDVWGRILNVSRTLTLDVSGKFFGFQEAGTFSADPWGQSPFYNGEVVAENFVLSDASYRTLLLTKALANICGGSIPELNALLMMLFPGRGDIYVQDNQNMTMVVVSTFSLSVLESTIILTSGVFPRPCGVGLDLSAP